MCIQHRGSCVFSTSARMGRGARFILALFAFALSAFAAPATHAQSDRFPKDFDSPYRDTVWPYGIYSDGTTMWVGDAFHDKIFAYKVSDGTRDAAKDFDTLKAAGNESLEDITSDGTTMWVADRVDRKIYAYNLSTKARDPGKDIDNIIGTGGNFYGIWVNATTMWLSVSGADRIYAYARSSGNRDTSKDIILYRLNDLSGGIWSDGTTMWVADRGLAGANAAKIYAYTLANGNRDTSKEFDALAHNNDYPHGLHSDGATMWVMDYDLNIRKIFAYRLASRTRYETALATASSNVAAVREDAGPLVYKGITLSNKAFYFTANFSPDLVAGANVRTEVSQVGDFLARGETGQANGTSPGAISSDDRLVGLDNDTIAEANGMAIMTILAQDDYRLGNPRATVVLVDDDAELTLAAGGGVTEGAAARFVVTHPAVQHFDLTVAVAISQSGDYIAAADVKTHQVVMAAGAGTATLDIDTVNDENTEDPGNVTATLGAGALYNIDMAAARATVTVTDDDQPRLSVADVSADESEDLVFTAMLRDRVGRPVTAPLRAVTAQWQVISDQSTATVGTDFTAPGGPVNLTIAVGQSNATFSVTVTDDMAQEDNETVAVRINMLANAVFAGGASAITVTGTIIDNERPRVTITADASGNRVAEGEDVVFTLGLSRAHGEDLAIPVRITHSGRVTEAAGERVVDIPAGGTAAKLTIATVDDGTDESNGSVAATIGALPDTHLGSGASATVTVADNDALPVLSVAAATAADTDRRIIFTVRLRPASGAEGTPSDLPVTVNFATSGNTAMSPRHYRDTSGFALFAPGDTEQRIAVNLNPGEDGNNEIEAFFLVLSNPQNATFANGATTPIRAIGSITEGIDRAQLAALQAAAAPRIAAIIGERFSATLAERAAAVFTGVPTASGLSLRGVSPRQFIAAGGEWNQSNYRERLALDPDEVAFAAALPFADGAWPWLNRLLELGSLTLWGRGYHGGIDYEAPNDGVTDLPLAFDGEVKGALLGMDAHNDNLMLGLALNEAEAALDYSVAGIDGAHRTELRGIHPYFARNLDRSRFWGGLGLHRGNMTATAGGRDTRFEVKLRSFNLGGHATLHTTGGADQSATTRLRLTGDMLFHRMVGQAEDAAAADDFMVDGATVRAGLEYAYSQTLSADGAWNARLATAVRQDDGDGPNGTGLEFGGGLGLQYPGLRLHLDARALADHETALKEWHLAAGLSWTPLYQRGLGVSFQPRWGGDSAGGGGHGGLGYGLELRYRLSLTREDARLSVFARDELAHSHRYGLGADYRISEAFSAGYETLIRPSEERHTDHRGYLRYRRGF